MLHRIGAGITQIKQAVAAVAYEEGRAFVRISMAERKGADGKGGVLRGYFGAGFQRYIMIFSQLGFFSLVAEIGPALPGEIVILQDTHTRWQRIDILISIFRRIQDQTGDVIQVGMRDKIILDGMTEDGVDRRRKDAIFDRFADACMERAGIETNVIGG